MRKNGYSFPTNGCKRQHYICASRKTKGCPVRKVIDLFPDGRQVQLITGQHNHEPPPPSKLRLSEETRQRVVTLTQTQLRPAKIEIQLQEEAYERGDMSPLTTPTRSQIKGIQARLKRGLHPSTDPLLNIEGLHGPNGTKFVQRVQTLPFVGDLLCTSKRSFDACFPWKNPFS